MAETLKEVIEKLKAQQQSSQQTPKPVEAVKVAVPKQEVQIPPEYEDDDDDDIEEEETKQLNPEQQKIQAILEEIELLQNNGRFRAELLHQLQEINQALVVIASAIASKK